MGNSVTVSIKNIYFSDSKVQKYIEQRLIDMVVNSDPYYFFNYDTPYKRDTSAHLTVYNTTCIYTENGIEWWGDLEYKTRRGQFHIRKISRLKLCKHCLCQVCHR